MHETTARTRAHALRTCGGRARSAYHIVTRACSTWTCDCVHVVCNAGCTVAEPYENMAHRGCGVITFRLAPVLHTLACTTPIPQTSAHPKHPVLCIHVLIVVVAVVSDYDLWWRLNSLEHVAAYGIGIGRETRPKKAGAVRLRRSLCKECVPHLSHCPTVYLTKHSSVGKWHVL